MIPDYESFMLPVVTVLSDGRQLPVGALRTEVAHRTGMTGDQLGERLPSGTRLFDSRVNWAITYLVQAGLLERPRRAVVEITLRGRRVLSDRPQRIDGALLSQFAEFREFKSRAKDAAPPTNQASIEATVPAVATSPRERLDQAINEANALLSADLLQRVRERDPMFLEELVLRLLTALGYGGRRGAAERLGKSGDQGLDGVVRQDALGLDRVYVQAKRYAVDNPVSRPDIQAFVGALHGAQADRGVFITTSRFTQEARDYAERVNARLVLMDGIQLADLMVQHDVGVQSVQAYVLKEVDEDFFEG